jgi:hypothetical protein
MNSKEEYTSQAHEASFETTSQTLGDTTFHLVLEKK